MIKFIDDFEKIEDMHFLVQKEVAEKINGKVSTKNWGKLALKISAFFNCEIICLMYQKHLILNLR